jgi:hypothetical protein
MGEKKRSVVKPPSIRKNRSTCSEQDIFMNQINPRGPGRGGDVSMNLGREPMGIEKNALNPTLEHKVKPVIQQRPSVHLNQTFWHRISQRTQPTANAGGEKQCAHDSS